LPTAPEEVVQQVRECLKQHAGSAGGHFNVQFEVDVTKDGQAFDARVKGSNLAQRKIEECMLQALRTMTVPSAILDDSSSAPISRSHSSRALMGYAIPNPVVVLAGFLVIYGMSVMVQITLRVMLSGVSLPAITMPMATATTSAPPIATAVTDATTDTVPESPKDIQRKCDEERTLCLHTQLASFPGGLHRHTRCTMCRDACVANGGVWPSRVPVMRGHATCVYWRTGAR
jgi:hypothetical protein